jgi:peptidoglycan/xylan/chitin deacetylase (PgdA/CDA1 family)
MFSKHIFLHITLIAVFATGIVRCGSNTERASSKNQPLVVLTFDDAVKSHLTFVAPVLREYGFGATFFVSYAWLEDTTHFLTWREVAEIHDLGFEIGNHSWTHANFSKPVNACELSGELGLVEWELRQVGVPKPVSYAHTGNAFGPEAIKALEEMGYKFARRGMQPEVPYGELKAGPGYDPTKHHPLLIPSTCDGYPEMDLKHFKKVLNSVKENEIAVLQFHGVPDIVHPWVNTPPERFKEYMDYLKTNNYRVIALKDLEEFMPGVLPDDPNVSMRFNNEGDKPLEWPAEVVKSRENKDFWLKNMALHHQYQPQEIAGVMGWDIDQTNDAINTIEGKKALLNQNSTLKLLPYPGGRHPRIGFKDGMLSPMRGTKLSLFLPWDESDFVVLDLPEAVFTQYGLTFLGHKHIPTIFDYARIPIVNRDWQREAGGSWTNRWYLPNNIEIGAKATPEADRVLMEVWLTNNTADTVLTGLQSQICVMLGQTKNYAEQTNDNKLFECPYAAVKADGSDQWIITAWQGCNHAWGNEDCPCLHADPRFPDCQPGETVNLKGIVWFYKGDDVAGEFTRMSRELSWL